MVATGHWYIESKHVDSMIQKAQLEKSEHHFQEDVEALGQLVSFAHFSELALELHGRVIVFYSPNEWRKGESGSSCTMSIKQ